MNVCLSANCLKHRLISIEREQIHSNYQNIKGGVGKYLSKYLSYPINDGMQVMAEETLHAC